MCVKERAKKFGSNLSKFRSKNLKAKLSSSTYACSCSLEKNAVSVNQSTRYMETLLWYTFKIILRSIGLYFLFMSTISRLDPYWYNVYQQMFRCFGVKYRCVFLQVQLQVVLYFYEFVSKTKYKQREHADLYGKQVCYRTNNCTIYISIHVIWTVFVAVGWSLTRVHERHLELII